MKKAVRKKNNKGYDGHDYYADRPEKVCSASSRDESEALHHCK